MLYTMPRKLSGFHLFIMQKLRKIYFHGDSPSCMIRQKEVEQIRRSVQRNKESIKLKNHSIDVEMNIRWTEITANQSENALFSSYFVLVARHRYSNTTRPVLNRSGGQNLSTNLCFVEILWQCQRTLAIIITQRLQHCVGMSYYVSATRTQIQCDISAYV